MSWAPGISLYSRNRLAPLEACQIDARIDYIFVRRGRPESPLIVERAAFIEDAPGGLPPEFVGSRAGFTAALSPAPTLVSREGVRRADLHDR